MSWTLDPADASARVARWVVLLRGDNGCYLEITLPGTAASARLDPVAANCLLSEYLHLTVTAEDRYGMNVAGNWGTQLWYGP